MEGEQGGGAKSNITQWSFWGGPESSEVNMPFQIKNIGNTSNGKLRLWWVPGKRKIFLLTEIVASVVGKLQSVLSNSPNLTFCSPETEIMIAPLFVVWFWFCKSGMMRFCINNDIMIHFYFYFENYAKKDACFSSLFNLKRTSIFKTGFLGFRWISGRNSDVN